MSFCHIDFFQSFQSPLWKEDRCDSCELDPFYLHFFNERIESMYDEFSEKFNEKPVGEEENRKQIKEGAMEFMAIGYVENGIHEVHKHDWEDVESKILVREELAEGLIGLETFSHAEIYFHLHKADFHLETDLMGRPRRMVENPLVGVFSRRTNHRPNGIGMSVVKILGVHAGVLTVRGLDAVEGTPILDIKPHIPKVKQEEVSLPEWAK